MKESDKVKSYVNAMDRDLVGKYEKYLEDIQMATTISVAHMLTLVKRRITVLDSGVDKSTNMWLSFDEDTVIHDKAPATIPISTIIQENHVKLTSVTESDSITNDDDIDPSLLTIPPPQLLKQLVI